MFAAMFNYLDLSNLISSITIVIVREYFTLVHLEDKHLDSFLILYLTLLAYSTYLGLSSWE
jgi:hypothetical protein